MAISEDCLLRLTPQSDKKQGVSHLQGKHLLLVPGHSHLLPMAEQHSSVLHAC